MKSVFTHSNCLSRQQISQYIAGTADRQTTHLIENHLLDCALCSTAVAGFAQQADPRAAIQQTEQLDYTYRTATAKWLRPLKAVASVAALVAISLAAGWWIADQRTPERLFAQHFTPYENDVTVSLRSPTSPEINELNGLNSALTAYDNRDFTESIRLLTERLRAQPQDEVATYYLGLSYLENEQFRQAAARLETVRMNSERYYAAASWYLALSHLKLENISTAELLLRELEQSRDTFYAEKATALLAEM